MKKYFLAIIILVAGVGILSAVRVSASPGGCASAPLPAGNNHQVPRCDGAQWVADGNILNDGEHVGVGRLPDTKTRLAVAADYYSVGIAGESGSEAGVRGQSYVGDGVVGQSSAGAGVRGIGAEGPGLWGETLANFGIGVFGKSRAGSALRGETETGRALSAHVSAGGFGVYQTGQSDSRNYFQNNVGIGTLAPTQKLEINGGLRLNADYSQPACDPIVRGTFWFLANNSGSDDAVRVCARSATGGYSWRALLLQ